MAKNSPIRSEARLNCLDDLRRRTDGGLDLRHGPDLLPHRFDAFGGGPGGRIGIRGDFFTVIDDHLVQLKERLVDTSGFFDVQPPIPG